MVETKLAEAQKRLAERRKQTQIAEPPSVPSVSGLMSKLRPKSDDEITAYEREVAERTRANLVPTLIAAADLPDRHAGMKVPRGDQWRAKRDSLDERLGSGYVALIVGDRGRGKTQMGVDLLHRCCLAGKSARYVKALDFFLALREAQRDGGKGESRVVAEFVMPQLLVVDAMEVRGETDFEDRVLNHVIDKRYDHRRDTILMGNQIKAEFEKVLGPSIVSRVAETGGCIVCDWKSYRANGGAA